MKKAILPLLTFLFSLLIVNATTIIRVATDGSNTADGLSWANAVNLARGRALAVFHGADHQLWLKAGTYDLTDAFNLGLDITMYGGFVGTETLLSQRNWITNQTIFNQTVTDKGVLWSNVSNCTVLLDGLIFQNGQKTTSAGGCGVLYSGTTLRNCIIRNNSTLGDGNRGGAFQLGEIGLGAAPATKIVIDNCLIINNESTAQPSCFYVQDYNNVDIVNTTIANNYDQTNEAGPVIGFATGTGSTFNLYNSVVYANLNGSTNSGVVSNVTASITLNNNAWRATPAVGTKNNNIVLGATSPFLSPTSFYGISNGTDKLFSAIQSADFSLPSSSSCNNAGNNSYVLSSTDLAGNSRTVATTVDMGCYELPPTITTSIASLTGLNYTFNAGPSVAQSFTVAGVNLSADITVTAPTDYEISLSAGAGYTSSTLTLTQTAGVVSTTTIYVRLKSGLAAASYNSETVQCTSTGAITQNITCSGTVKVTPTVIVTPINTYTYNGSPQGPIAATTGGSTGAMTYSYVGVSGTVYGPSATLPTIVGSYTATASVAADANYNSASSSATAFTIGIASQTITFGALSTKARSDAPFALGATASSTLGVSYVSSNTAVATISGSTVTIVGSGTTNITASQAGNSNYSAAVDVIQALVVSATYNITASSSISSIADITASSDLVLSGSGTTLTIDVDKTVHSITVAPDTKLDLGSKTLSVTDMVLQAGKANASSVMVTHAMGLTGTLSVQKTLDKSIWYFVSFPSDVNVNSITQVSGSGVINTANLGTSWWIKYYDGAGRASNLGATSNWQNKSSGDVLEANQGYIIGIANSLDGDYVLSFPLNSNLVTIAESSKTVAVGTYGEGTAPATSVGWNLVGSPYLSRLDGSGINANYLTFYNGSSYTQVAKAAVGRYIYPFESFFIQASALGTGTALDFGIGSRRLAPAASVAYTTDEIQLNLTNATGADHANLILDDKQSTAYEINQDLEKWLTIGNTNPQLYSILGSTKFAYNALPMASVQDLPLGVYAPLAGTAKLSTAVIRKSKLSHLMLTDKSNGAVTDLLVSDYNFTAEKGTNNTRFTVSAWGSIATENKLGNIINEPTVQSVSGKLVLNNLSRNINIKIFDALGRLVFAGSSTKNSFELDLKMKAVFVVEMEMEGELYVRKFINY